MRIKGFFGILVFLLLVLGGGLLFLSSRLNMIYFYIGEGLVLFILCYLPFFYRKIVKPLNSIGSGMELLREQDFSSRLSPVGQYEADRIVNVFNRMMEQLKNERLRLREQNNFLDLLIKASPMGVILTTLDEDLSELNPMAQKMLGVRQEDVLGKKMNEIDSPLAAELANVPKGETATVRLNDSNIYRCTHSSFIDRGFQHPFFLIESLTDEVMKAEKKAYEKVIRMIAHEVNNTTAGITSTLDTLFGKEFIDSCLLASLHPLLFGMRRFAVVVRSKKFTGRYGQYRFSGDGRGVYIFCQQIHISVRQFLLIHQRYEIGRAHV